MHNVTTIPCLTSTCCDGRWDMYSNQKKARKTI